MLFLAVTTLPLFYSAYFLYRQQHIRYEMKEKLEAQYLQTITLNKNEVSWIKKNKEIKIGDHLFDVKEWYTEGDNVILKGLYDKQEDALHVQLDKLQRNNSDKKSSTATFTQLLLIPLFFETQISAAVFPVKQIKTHSFYFALFPDLNLPGHFPPPKA